MHWADKVATKQDTTRQGPTFSGTGNEKGAGEVTNWNSLEKNRAYCLHRHEESHESGQRNKEGKIISTKTQSGETTLLLRTFTSHQPTTLIGVHLILKTKKLRAEWQKVQRKGLVYWSQLPFLLWFDPNSEHVQIFCVVCILNQN